MSKGKVADVVEPSTAPASELEANGGARINFRDATKIWRALVRVWGAKPPEA